MEKKLVKIKRTTVSEIFDKIKASANENNNCKSWNTWREQNSHKKLTLKNLDFSGLNLQGIFLENINFQDSKFCSTDLKNANFIKVSLSKATFIKANLKMRHLKIQKYHLNSYKSVNV